MKSPTVVVPYFGDDPRYLRMLDDWMEQYLKSTCVWPVVIVTDRETHCPYPHKKYSLKPYEKFIRQGEAFDVKGALMAEAILEFTPCLIVDCDALIMRDPSVILLEQFHQSPCAMPLDLGANPNPDRPRYLNRPYMDIKRTCGGILWSGNPLCRHTLVEEWKYAFQELLSLSRLPWSPPIPCLVEQFAWSVALHRMKGDYLPESFNWPPHLCGPNPDAIIDHYFGGRKLKPTS